MAAGAIPSNRKIKAENDAETQGADGMQVMSVIYMTQLEAVFQQENTSWEKGGLELPAPHVSAQAPAT